MNTHTKTPALTKLATASGREAHAGNAVTNASVNPMTYMATETAWARKNTIPIEPPNSTPRLRLIM